MPLVGQTTDAQLKDLIFPKVPIFFQGRGKQMVGRTRILMIHY